MPPEVENAYGSCGFAKVRQALPEFAFEGARMLLVHPGTCHDQHGTSVMLLSKVKCHEAEGASVPMA